MELVPDGKRSLALREGAEEQLKDLRLVLELLVEDIGEGIEAERRAGFRVSFSEGRAEEAPPAAPYQGGGQIAAVTASGAGNTRWL